jgi:hypothetical protein
VPVTRAKTRKARAPAPRQRVAPVPGAAVPDLGEEPLPEPQEPAELQRAPPARAAPPHEDRLAELRALAVLSARGFDLAGLEALRSDGVVWT